MSEFIPELGQAVFGQPHQRYNLPEIWEAAFLRIERELERVMWNKNQEEYRSPFFNTGGCFDGEVFSVHAYSWDEENEQRWNFKWRDVRVSWYKHMCRGASANEVLTPDMAAEMLTECLAMLRKMDEDREHQMRSTFEAPPAVTAEQRALAFIRLSQMSGFGET